MNISQQLSLIYKYIYTILYKYPAPNIVIIRFENDVVEKNMVAIFHQSCAKILNIPQGKLIYLLSQTLPPDEANLVINLEQLNYLYQHNFIPYPDISTEI